MESFRISKEYLGFLYFFQDLELSECNGNYQRLVFDRVTAYCDLLAKPFEALTLGEIKSIFDGCNQEFNFKDAA